MYARPNGSAGVQIAPFWINLFARQACDERVSTLTSCPLARPDRSNHHALSASGQDPAGEFEAWHADGRADRNPV